MLAPCTLAPSLPNVPYSQAISPSCLRDFGPRLGNVLPGSYRCPGCSDPLLSCTQVLAGLHHPVPATSPTSVPCLLLPERPFFMPSRACRLIPGVLMIPSPLARPAPHPRTSLLALCHQAGKLTCLLVHSADFSAFSIDLHGPRQDTGQFLDPILPTLSCSPFTLSHPHPTHNPLVPLLCPLSVHYCLFKSVLQMEPYNMSPSEIPCSQSAGRLEDSTTLCVLTCCSFSLLSSVPLDRCTTDCSSSLPWKEIRVLS